MSLDDGAEGPPRVAAWLVLAGLLAVPVLVLIGWRLVADADNLPAPVGWTRAERTVQARSATQGAHETTQTDNPARSPPGFDQFLVGLTRL